MTTEKCGLFWLNACLDESAVREYGEEGVDVRFRGEVQPGPHVPTYPHIISSLCVSGLGARPDIHASLI